MSSQTATQRKPFFQPATPISLDEFLHGAGLNILMVIASGVLASFMFPPREVWWFAWLYLVPLLIALRRTGTVRAAGWLTLLFGMVFFMCTLTWLWKIFATGVIGVAVLASLPWVLFGLLYRTLAGMASGFRSHFWKGVLIVLLAPVFWLAFEWIRCEGWYFQFSWAQFGFSFASARNGGVLYPYLGVYGITFCIVLVNALIAELFLTKMRWGGKITGIALCAAGIVPLCLYLNYPIGSPLQPGEKTSSFRVGIVQNENGDIQELKKLTYKLKEAKPNLIVWPEYAVIDYPLSKPFLLGQLQEVAREMQSTLILGCKAHAPKNARVDWLRRHAMMSMDGELWGNIALVISPKGEVLGTYQKAHPIQFFSDGVPGTRFNTFATDVGRLGIAICYDMDFSATFRKLVDNGAEVLVVPTFDSREWSVTQHTQHARMAQARAAEAGRWVVRATSSGDSQVVNPGGFVTAIIWSSNKGSTMGLAVPRTERTPYLRVTYLLPFICLGITLACMVGMVVLAVIRRKQAS